MKNGNNIFELSSSIVLNNIILEYNSIKSNLDKLIAGEEKRNDDERNLICSEVSKFIRELESYLCHIHAWGMENSQQSWLLKNKSVFLREARYLAELIDLYKIDDKIAKEFLGIINKNSNELRKFRDIYENKGLVHSYTLRYRTAITVFYYKLKDRIKKSAKSLCERILNKIKETMPDDVKRLKKIQAEEKLSNGDKQAVEYLLQMYEEIKQSDQNQQQIHQDEVLAKQMQDTELNLTPKSKVENQSSSKIAQNKGYSNIHMLIPSNLQTKITEEKLLSQSQLVKKEREKLHGNIHTLSDTQPKEISEDAELQFIQSPRVTK